MWIVVEGLVEEEYNILETVGGMSGKVMYCGQDGYSNRTSSMLFFGMRATRGVNGKEVG